MSHDVRRKLGRQESDRLDTDNIRNGTLHHHWCDWLGGDASLHTRSLYSRLLMHADIEIRFSHIDPPTRRRMLLLREPIPAEADTWSSNWTEVNVHMLQLFHDNKLVNASMRHVVSLESFQCLVCPVWELSSKLTHDTLIFKRPRQPIRVHCLGNLCGDRIGTASFPVAQYHWAITKPASK